MTDYDTRGIAVAGAAGGITNGLVGAWGPVVTPFLLHRRVPPRITVGSVNTAEVAVAAVAVGSLFASLGRGGVDMGVVLAMLIGGVLAAPIAAWVIRFLPARGMGVAVSGLLLSTNVRELSTWQHLGVSRWIAYGAVGFARLPMPVAVTVVSVGVVGLMVLVGWPRRRARTAAVPP